MYCLGNTILIDEQCKRMLLAKNVMIVTVLTVTMIQLPQDLQHGRVVVVAVWLHPSTVVQFGLCFYTRRIHRHWDNTDHSHRKDVLSLLCLFYCVSIVVNMVAVVALRCLPLACLSRFVRIPFPLEKPKYLLGH